jgi:hypothetical protein
MKKITNWQNFYLTTIAITLAALLVIQIYHAKASENDIASNHSESVSPDFIIDHIYHAFGDVTMPKFDVFQKAMRGYAKLRSNNHISNDTLLTVMDFRMSANEKRMWVLDIKNKKVLFNCLVAHGRNTGEEFAEKFSNIPQSFKSSIGFYVTGGTYTGEHGLSLYLDGMEKGFNDKARDRYIVMHGADYVSEKFIEENGRLGRSLGCPAISRELQDEIIPLIAEKTCMFIYAPHTKYELASKLINSVIKADMLAMN